MYLSIIIIISKKRGHTFISFYLSETLFAGNIHRAAIVAAWPTLTTSLCDPGNFHPPLRWSDLRCANSWCNISEYDSCWNTCDSIHLFIASISPSRAVPCCMHVTWTPLVQRKRPPRQAESSQQRVKTLDGCHLYINMYLYLSLVTELYLSLSIYISMPGRFDLYLLDLRYTSYCIYHLTALLPQINQWFQILSTILWLAFGNPPFPATHNHPWSTKTSTFCFRSFSVYRPVHVKQEATVWDLSKI